MVITYHGAECFKIQFGDTIVAYNPISKEGELPATRFGADIALISTNHANMNGVDQVSFGDRTPFVIDGPGEYEVKGITVRGFPSVTSYGAKTGAPNSAQGETGETKMNAMYRLTMEGMNLVFVGALSSPNIPTESKEVFDDVDILFVPIGGDGVLSPADAYKLAVGAEPKLIIPMHFEALGEKGALDAFLKEAGEKVEPLDKLTLKKKELEGKEGDIVVLQS